MGLGGWGGGRAPTLVLAGDLWGFKGRAPCLAEGVRGREGEVRKEGVGAGGC
jgi:hypothetical protein